MGRKKLLAVDCETDPFKYGRVPKPFIWGCYDGSDFQYWFDTDEFVEYIKNQDAIVYAHNGGKFDFMYLMPYIKKTTARIIGGRFAEMSLGRSKLRDSYSIVPVPLSAIQKDDINYELMEEHCREQYMYTDIIPYLKTDCCVLWDMVSEYRAKAGKALTIASNAMQSSKKLGVNPGRTNHRFDTQFRPYYFGGRTECFQPGTHKNGKVLDIVSSYPNAMSRDHATGDDYDYYDDLSHCRTDDEIGRSFIHLDCKSHGAFPKHNEKGGLDFPHTTDEFFITGWEYLIAKKHGLIEDECIFRVTSFKNTINFSDYIQHWFEHKKTHPKADDPINYTIGKIMMNSRPAPDICWGSDNLCTVN
jgi:hypothetical protein